MDDLPLDTGHPAVRDYLSLIRLQVLTPLSLLINIATLMICALVVSPSLGQVVKWYPASLSPYTPLIAAYIAAIYVCQIGYCILLVIARKPETKATVVKGVGMALVFSNFVMAAWAITWIFRLFLVSTILLGILLLLLIYCNIVLFTYHPPTLARPLDVALIHAPIRLFLILPLALLFPYSLFVTLGHAWDPAHPDHYQRHQWEGFGVTLGVNLIGLIIVAVRRDIVWCVGATWINIAIWATKLKPAPVYITCIMFTVLQPLVLIGSAVWVTFLKPKNQGRIVLPPDEEGEVIVTDPNSDHYRSQNRNQNNERVAQEVDANWG